VPVAEFGYPPITQTLIDRSIWLPKEYVPSAIYTVPPASIVAFKSDAPRALSQSVPLPSPVGAILTYFVAPLAVEKVVVGRGKSETGKTEDQGWLSTVLALASIAFSSREPSVNTI